MGIVLGRKPGGGSSSGGAPSGAAGGDLAGTYPDPTIAAAYTAARISNSIVDAKGDIIAASAADTVARLAVGVNGTVLTAASGQTTGLSYALPPGYEFAYAEETTGTVTSTATTAGTADTIVTAAAVTFDGTTVALIEFYAPGVECPPDGTTNIELYEDGSAIGSLGFVVAGADPAVTAFAIAAVTMQRRMTPAAGSRTYSARLWGTAGTKTVYAGVGGSGVAMPAFIRITKV